MEVFVKWSDEAPAAWSSRSALWVVDSSLREVQILGKALLKEQAVRGLQLYIREE